MQLNIYMPCAWDSAFIGITQERGEQFILFKGLQFHETCSVRVTDCPDTWYEIRLIAVTDEDDRYTAVRITHQRHTVDAIDHKIEVNPCLRYSTDDSMDFDIEIDGD